MRVGLLIIGLLLGLFVGYCLWFPIWQIPAQFKYDILKDTLIIVLTVLAVGIGGTSYAVYRILSGALETRVALASRLESVQEAVRLFIHEGFVFWESYEKSPTQEPQHIEIAIGLTERALIFFSQLPQKVAHSKENERQYCLIKNNLAYYYALRGQASDKDTAREYIEYVRNKISEYPADKANWLETYDFVKQKYPDESADNLAPQA